MSYLITRWPSICPVLTDKIEILCLADAVDGVTNGDYYQVQTLYNSSDDVE